MNFSSFIYDAIVPIHCGSKNGTAFFVEPNRLITARHVVSDALRNNTPVEVILKGTIIICSKTEVLGTDNDLSDVTILTVDKYTHPSVLQLLSIPPTVKKKLFVAGYPLEIGNNRDLFDFEIHNSTTVTGNEYDVVASPKELIPFTSYRGFSGSPVITDDGFVVGVITDKISRVVGYSTVMQWCKELTSKGLNIYDNWEDYDNSFYGYGRSVALIKEAVKKAGDRYSPDIHVANKDLEADINIFCSKTEQERKKSLYPSVEKWYMMIQSKYPFIKDGYKPGSYADLAPCLWKLRDDYNNRYKNTELQEYTKIEKTDIDVVNNQLEKLNEIFNTSRDLLNSQCALIHGIAGSGKTHFLCQFAESHETKCQPYLLYGGQFVANEGFLHQVEELLGFPEGIKGLNDYMDGKCRYAVIIVDAINEGVGLAYWKDILVRLPKEVEKFGNIRFIFSARIPDNSDIYVNLYNQWVLRSIEGFFDYTEALDKYFDKFGVDKKLKNNTFFEFNNPLFLRIFCIAYSRIPCHKRQSITKLELFLIYLQARNKDIANIIDEDVYLDATSSYLMKLAEISLENTNDGEITRKDARNVSYELYPYKPWHNSLLYACLQETLLLESYGKDRTTPCVEYEFENLGDFLRVVVFLKKGMKGADVIKYLSSKKNQIGDYGHSKMRFVHFVGALLSVESDNLHDFAETALAGQDWNDELLDTLQYRGPLRQRIISKFIKEGNTNLLPSLVREAKAYSFSEMESLHEQLLQMSLSERDLKWSSQVNNLYDWNGQQPFIDLLMVKHTREATDDDTKKAVVLMLWMLSSSYPALRTILIRHILSILFEKPKLTIEIIELFKKCNDPYVLEGLYCAIYGIVLKTRDVDVLSTIAKSIYNNYYAEGSNVPNDWLIRYWTMKILERTTCLIPELDYWSKVRPPFETGDNPYRLIDNAAIINDKYFGESKGSYYLFYSLFKESDFNRYIIGTNTSTTDKLLVNRSTHESVLLDDIIKMIGSRIKEFGWNDNLGRLDDDKYSYFRFSNETERMGKKYQWIAYYDIMGRLTDYCSIRKDKYSINKDEMQIINYPWYASVRNYIDPTLDVNEYKSSPVNLLVTGTLNIVGAEKENWIDDSELVPEFRSCAKDKDDQLFIMLYGFDEVKKEEKEFVVISNAAFVKNDNSAKFKKWCEIQNFYGRWMPERRGSIDFLWSEYPWADSYKSSVEEEEWERPSNECPCNVMVSYAAQLQEHWEGIAYEDQYLTTVHMPCREMMEQKGLYCSEVRGIIKSEIDDKIIAVNLNNEDGMRGLFIRKDVLDEFLSENGYTMFYYVLGEKTLRLGGLDLIRKDLSAAYQYNPDGDILTIQSIRVVE